MKSLVISGWLFLRGILDGEVIYGMTPQKETTNEPYLISVTCTTAGAGVKCFSLVSKNQRINVVWPNKSGIIVFLCVNILF